MALLRDPFAGYLASLPSPPLVLVSEFFLRFTQRVAGVPRVMFHDMSAFSLALCFSLATRPPPVESIQDSTPFIVLRFPQSVTITADEVPHAVAQDADLDDLVTQFLFDDLKSFYLVGLLFLATGES
ncbi:unnamed protein product [Miscanthus lutarioriparius]|uniref:Uncharacterized protein n=1 Tax=Miscanthus lutarioriparius TaxID=422564 RepID=A0A811N3B8_9POAL|nr:unnamed protein product [Miscanthus lutarioriparius]